MRAYRSPPFATGSTATGEVDKAATRAPTASAAASARLRQWRSSASTSARLEQTAVPSSSCCALSSGISPAAVDSAAGPSAHSARSCCSASSPSPRREATSRARGPSGTGRPDGSTTSSSSSTPTVRTRPAFTNGERECRTDPTLPNPVELLGMFDRYPQHPGGFSTGPSVPLPLVTSRRRPRIPRLVMRRPEGAVAWTTAGDHNSEARICWG